MREGDRVVFMGGWHDIVKVGDCGIIERVLTEEERKEIQETWETDEDYKYQVCFNGTVLTVCEDDVVPVAIASLVQF